MCVDGGGDRWAGVTEHRGDCATSIPSAIISEAAEWRRTWGWHAAGWSARDDPTASGSTTSRRSSTRSNGSGTPITGPTTCAPSSLGTTGSTTSCSYGHQGYLRGGGGTPATPPSTSPGEWFGVGDVVARRRLRRREPVGCQKSSTPLTRAFATPDDQATVPSSCRPSSGAVSS